MTTSSLPLILLLGPTAVGKSETALQLAERLNGEIISADSRTFYRGMDIGTAKPSLEERARVPHHLIDIAEPDERWSLADFQRAIYEVVDDIHARGKLPLLVGGTGQYVHAITDGWVIPEQEPDPRMRETLEKWAAAIGGERLHAGLAKLDPDAGAAIDWHNVRRTVRALEVIFLTGQRFSAQRQRGTARYRTIQIGLTRPRADLYARIDARIEMMLEAGWVEEVRTLLARGFSPTLPSLSAIGYREIIQYLQGEYALEEAVILIKRKTREFVRRQGNWFKADDPAIRWFEMNPGVRDEIVNYLLSII
ncbi:MAG: tRNA (adenosine(37)-N6)-dimethylallyltransferase MiaA [Anaerolineales bacterium]|nr:tRNA (adenosine(37)-N6)-dimethylallyltransferase MiaA [Anaerolineales bacterium]